MHTYNLSVDYNYKTIYMIIYIYIAYVYWMHNSIILFTILLHFIYRIIYRNLMYLYLYAITLMIYSILYKNVKIRLNNNNNNKIGMMY
jgi:hypothetical protein